MLINLIHDVTFLLPKDEDHRDEIPAKLRLSTVEIMTASSFRFELDRVSYVSMSATLFFVCLYVLGRLHGSTAMYLVIDMALFLLQFRSCRSHPLFAYFTRLLVFAYIIYAKEDLYMLLLLGLYYYISSTSLFWNHQPTLLQLMKYLLPRYPHSQALAILCYWRKQFWISIRPHCPCYMRLDIRFRLPITFSSGSNKFIP